MHVLVEVGGQTNANTPLQLDYMDPSIVSVSPSTGNTTGNYPVRVSGSNFGLTGTVFIDGEECQVAARDPTAHSWIDCTLPPGQGENLRMKVVVLGHQSSEVDVLFSYDAPTISVANLRLRAPASTQAARSLLTETHVRSFRGSTQRLSVLSRLELARILTSSSRRVGAVGQRRSRLRSATTRR